MKFSLFNFLLLFIIVGLSIALVLERNKEVVIALHHDNVVWPVTQDLIDSSPSWSNDENNPPLSVREAIDIAGEIRANLDKATKSMKIGPWFFESLIIAPMDNVYESRQSKWCYVAHFHAVHENHVSGHIYNMPMLILMDGQVMVGLSGVDSEIWDAIRLIYPKPSANGG